MTAITPKTEIASDSRFWTIDEVAAHYRTSVATLRYWRYTRYGPKGTRVGRSVLYPQAEIERFDREIGERAAAESAAFGDVPE
jgi:hypothetical protein